MISARHLWLVSSLLVLPAAAQNELLDALTGDHGYPVLTHVRIAGMTTLSESNALALLGDRLEHVRRQRPDPSRASDAAFMAERLFRSHGFNQAEVSWQIVGSDMIQLIVKEGPRQQLGTVTVEGVDAETARKLRKLFELPAVKRRVAPGERPPFLDSDLDEGLAQMRAEFQSRGYWSAEVTLGSRSVNPKTGFHDVVIVTKPGPEYRIGRPDFSGAPSGERSAAQAAAEFVGRVADTAAVNGMRAAVEESYRKLGFADAEIRMSNTLVDGQFLAHFTIVEGERFRLGEVAFDGLQKTRPERVRQRFDDLEGKTYDPTVMEKRLRGMMATGAFESVRLETIRRGGGVLDATLHFEEGEARGYAISAGLATYEGPILGMSYYDRNFLGTLRNLNGGFEISARTVLGEVSLADPWLWGTDASGLARLYMLNRDHEGYYTWKAGGELGADYPVSDHYKLSLRAGYAFVNSNEDGIPAQFMGETVYGNPYIRFVQRLDYRDSAVLPTKGWQLEAPLELGAALGEISSGYLKSELEVSWYHRLGPTGQVALGARAGTLMASGDHFDLPIDLRYFLGGPRSVRSFPERELGPRSTTGYPLGGEAYWVTNAEYIHPLFGALKGVAFVDAGGLSSQWRDFGTTSPDVAAGLGLRLDLPVGPVRLEYGHNLTKDANEPSGTWHFAIGVAF